MITSINEFAKSLSSEDLILINIRSVTNSFSSTDKKVHLLGKNKIKNVSKKLLQNYGAWYHSKDIENLEIDGKTYNVFEITIAPDFKNVRFDRNKGLSKEKKIEIKDELIKDLNFKEDYPTFYKDFLKKEHDQYKINYEKEREEKGYVLTKYDSKDQTTKDYVGGFDLNIIFKEHLISYIERGLVAGYIGHSCRKIWVDRLLAKICLSVIKDDDFASWLTSTGGRHFGNAIESMVEADDKSGVEKYIEKQLPFIHDQAVVYNYPGHGGTLKSSKEIWDKLHEMGMTMCENNPFAI